MVVALQEELYRHLQEGTVIPAHPLALTERKELDKESQKRLTRYYISAGAGGVAVGVHTTQFEIRDPKYNLLEKVLALAAEAIEEVGLKRPFLKIAGICGETKQAVREAEIARNLGYHLGLVSLGGLNHYSEQDLVRHVKEISQIIPVFGFYLQPAVGGRILSYEFWREVAEIKNLYAIKIAPFNRYQTLVWFEPSASRQGAGKSHYIPETMIIFYWTYWQPIVLTSTGKRWKSKLSAAFWDNGRSGLRKRWNCLKRSKRCARKTPSRPNI
jgi:Dihydrodipicolinate synthetase family